jgi:ribosome-associated protein
MVIATGRSERHVKSLAQSVITSAKEAGHPPRGSEGQLGGEWVLVDLGDVVVHVMQAQARAFYQLEKLWDVPPMAAATP